MCFTVGFLMTALGVAGGKKSGLTVGFEVGLGVALTVGFLGACEIVFLTLLLPLRASIII